MEIKELHKKDKTKLPPEKYDELLKKARKDHDVLRKGMFEFIDAQGGWLEFSTRFFPGQPIQTIKINHGEIVELPMGIIRHLNNTKKKIRKFGMDAGTSKTRGGEIPERGGLPNTYEVQSRVRFTPMDVL